ncbi:MAG TPA: proline dehydrogenase family protein [Vicinamibacterales bacterium]|nr:proline dehydrogenase family protein [Vicinamibacterales bacterium]
MLDAASKTFFHLIAQSRTLNRLASRYGMRKPTSFARRFIAGETVAEAIAAARGVQARTMLITLDLLGESVTNLEEADAATRAYLGVIDAIIASGIERNISLKLTQLGLDVDKASAVDNLRKILGRAEPAGFFVRIDMESSAYTEVTLEIFETLWRHGYRQIGVVLQTALYRSEEQDLARVNALGARIRLVKGAYKEPKTVAHQRKADVDAAYERMMKKLMADGHYPAIATHDPHMIDAARAWARDRGIAADRFEFQMLYGVRRDLQATLVREGYRVRVYIPFGREWFPYFMRRLGERPANVMFVVRGILVDSG